MRILITGSSGRLGSEIARQLAPDHEITGLDMVAGNYTTHVATLSDLKTLAELVNNVEAVIHTASLHALHIDSFSRQDFIETNITGVLNLLELCVAARIKRFVYTSTTSIYGFAMLPANKTVWVSEELVPQPRDIYDITKIAAEQLCKVYSLEHGLKTICLRTSRFFPQSPELLALYRLYRGADVRDIAQAHVLAVTNPNIEFDIFNICSNHPYQPEEMQALFEEPVTVLRRYYPDIEAIFHSRGWQLPTSLDRVYVTRRAQETLGYRPQYNFDEYIANLQ